MGNDDDRIDNAVMATQRVILGLLEENGSNMEDAARELGVEGGMTTWMERPVMTYQQFLHACIMTKTSAGRMFSLTKESVASAEPARRGDYKDHGKDIDSGKAGITASGDVILRWSSIISAMSKATNQDVEKVRGLFIGVPHVIDPMTIEIDVKAHEERTRDMILRLLHDGINHAGVINGDRITIRLSDS